MIKETAAGQGLQAARVPAATLHYLSDQHTPGIVRSNHGAADHSRRPGQSARLDAGSVSYAGQRGEAAPCTADSGLRKESPDDSSESTRRAVLDDSALVRSMLDFGEHPTGLHVRRNGLSLPDGMSFDSWHELGLEVALVRELLRMVAW